MRVLAAMRATRYGKQGLIIGRVKRDPQKRVLLRTTFSGVRVVEILTARCYHGLIKGDGGSRTAVGSLLVSLAERQVSIEDR